MTTGTDTLVDNSQLLAGWQHDQHTIRDELYAHNSGQYFVIQHDVVGGGPSPQWITREQAIDYIATHAVDCVTGHGYSADQAATMVDGDDAGHGQRNRDDDDDNEWRPSFGPWPGEC